MDKQLFFKNGSFKLLQLTDIHFANDDEEDHRTVALMRELIAAEKPDFIMTTGDTVTSEQNLDFLETAMAPVLESGIPWGFVFGNHDVEYASNREELFSRVLALPGCMSSHDPSSGDGVGNCCLQLCGPDGKPEWVLFGIDSGDYSTLPQVEGYGYVTRSQIDWYRKKTAEYEKINPQFSSMVYMHMALPEHDEVWKYEVCYGVRREGACCPMINSGFFCAMLEAGHTKGVFVGHDHVNDYWGKLHGIALGYGRCTGFCTYGAQDFLRGGRVFVFTQGNTESFDTYVRLEHGIVVDDPWVHTPLSRRDWG